MLTMTRPVIIPFRWLGHGLDLRMTVIGSTPYFAAADVTLAMQVDLEAAGVIPDLFLDVVDATGNPLELVTVNQVYEIHRHQPMYLDNGFIDWFGSILDDHAIDHDHLQQLVDGALPDEPGHKDSCHDVAAAARILKRDHDLDYGRERLFRALNGLSWTTRDSTGVWVPNDMPLRAGYLVRRNVRVQQRKGYYPQILVTDAGILALAALLADPEPTATHLEHA